MNPTNPYPDLDIGEDIINGFNERDKIEKVGSSTIESISGRWRKSQIVPLEHNLCVYFDNNDMARGILSVAKINGFMPQRSWSFDKMKEKINDGGKNCIRFMIDPPAVNLDKAKHSGDYEVLLDESANKIISYLRANGQATFDSPEPTNKNWLKRLMAYRKGNASIGDLGVENESELLDILIDRIAEVMNIVGGDDCETGKD